MVTAKDVAKRAEVSQATVSYVMNGNRPISDEVKTRVRAAMKDLGYYPNISARALAGGRSGIIALMLRMDRNTQLDELLPFITTITHKARERGSNVMLLPAEEGLEAVQRLTGQSTVDAIIMFDIERKDPRVKPMSKLGIPVVLIGNPDDSAMLCCVDIDYLQIPYLLADELSSTGATRVLAIGDSGHSYDQYWFSRAFEDGMCNAVKDCGLGFELFRPDSASWSGISPLKERMSKWHHGEYAIAVRTPRETGYVLQMLIEQGLVPGRDVFLASICEDDIALNMRVPVTNVSPRAMAVSESAVDTLFRLLDGENVVQKRQFIAPTLTRRETTSHSQG